jgi:exopolyphosphatase/guanosine-5'-triphosphate,3'-diphosphate pyrophosphatase
LLAELVSQGETLLSAPAVKGFNVDAEPGGTAIGGLGRGAGGGKRPGQRGLGANSARKPLSDGPVYGALDLGTNNCRLLLARPNHAGFSVIDAFSRIVRLGEGLGTSGELKQEAMDRTIDALRVCSNKMKWHRVGPKRLVATEACRLARNGADFIARVEAELGLALEIIDRETEARLAAAGAEPLIAEEANSAVVFDIGGGSTEVMWVERGEKTSDVKAWISLKAGVVTLSERHGGGRDVTAEQFHAMRNDVAALLDPFLEDVRDLDPAGPDHLLGTSGTVTTIAGVHLGLRHYDRSLVDGTWLENEEAERVVSRLLSMGYEQRTQNGCIGGERADLVLAGCAIMEEIRQAFPAKRIRVADRGLREGILASLMRADGHLSKRT